MLSHVIPPPPGYTKVSNGFVRHSRLGSDAKILVIYVQGLPEGDRDKALSEHARALHFTGRRYQKAKAELVASGYVHEKRETVAGGRWRTVQVFSNVPLTDDQAARLRAGVPADGYELVSTTPAPAPSVRFPTVGAPSGQVVGGQLPADEEPGKNESHPPTEAGSDDGEQEGPEGSEEASVGPLQELPHELPQEPSDGPEVAVAERVLLSLRHEQRQLHLGVREAPYPRRARRRVVAARGHRCGPAAGPVQRAAGGGGADGGGVPGAPAQGESCPPPPRACLRRSRPRRHRP